MKKKLTFETFENFHKFKADWRYNFTTFLLEKQLKLDKRFLKTNLG